MQPTNINGIELIMHAARGVGVKRAEVSAADHEGEGSVVEYYWL